MEAELLSVVWLFQLRLPRSAVAGMMEDDLYFPHNKLRAHTSAMGNGNVENVDSFSGPVTTVARFLDNGD